MNDDSHPPEAERADVGVFPGADSLCEGCGYCLGGLVLGQGCPECGVAISESDVSVRTGLAWQDRATLRGWIKTVFWVGLRPGRSFRVLKLGGSNVRARMFLMMIVCGLAGYVWGVFEVAHIRWAWGWGLLVLIGVPIATYVEAVGVTYWSRQKGWRVPFGLAERVVCYASVGWVPAILVMAKVQLLVDQGLLMNWWNPNWGAYTFATDVVLSASLAGASILWFETLVWKGVNQVRFGNSSA